MNEYFEEKKCIAAYLVWSLSIFLVALISAPRACTCSVREGTRVTSETQRQTVGRQSLSAGQYLQNKKRFIIHIILHVDNPQLLALWLPDSDENNR